MRVFGLDGMQRMFRQSDQTNQNRTVGWNRVRALRGKEKKKNLKSSPSIDRSISPTPIPSRARKSARPPPPPFTHPIQSDPIIPPRYLSIGWRKLHVHSFFPMHANSCLY